MKHLDVEIVRSTGAGFSLIRTEVPRSRVTSSNL
jgi:hypothetical protein